MRAVARALLWIGRLLVQAAQAVFQFIGLALASAVMLAWGVAVIALFVAAAFIVLRAVFGA